MNEQVYEFVVTGRLGLNLRSMLEGLEIQDRPPRTLLALQHSDQATLLRVVAGISAGAAEIDTIRSWPSETGPRSSPEQIGCSDDPMRNPLSRKTYQ